jgi:hypothetical protein
VRRGDTVRPAPAAREEDALEDFEQVLDRVVEIAVTVRVRDAQRRLNGVLARRQFLLDGHVELSASLLPLAVHRAQPALLHGPQAVGDEAVSQAAPR